MDGCLDGHLGREGRAPMPLTMPPSPAAHRLRRANPDESVFAAAHTFKAAELCRRAQAAAGRISHL